MVKETQPSRKKKDLEDVERDLRSPAKALVSSGDCDVPEQNSHSKVLLISTSKSTFIHFLCPVCEIYINEHTLRNKHILCIALFTVFGTYIQFVNAGPIARRPTYMNVI